MSIAAAANALQAALQVLQQAFGLLTFAGDLLLVAAQIGAFGLQRVPMRWSIADSR